MAGCRAEARATHVRVFGGDRPDGATLDQAIGFAVETLKRGADARALAA